MTIRFPRPLRPGDRIGVTAPSSGVPDALRERLEVAVRDVESLGYEVVLGNCLDGSGYVSAPAAERAAELTAMLTDPAIRAVVPPWGGELGIDLFPHLDLARLAEAEPTWLVGYSDLSTWLAPLTLVTRTATLHGANLMETPYDTPDGLLSWPEILTAPPGHRFTQTAYPFHRAPGHDDWAGDPTVREERLDVPGTWTRLDGTGEVTAEGRLIGGCTEILSRLAGTPYLDTAAFAREESPEGLLVYVEACEDNAFSICRDLHGLRLTGFFDRATAILVGRTHAPGSPGLSQHDAVLDALGSLGVPIVADIECGHVRPHLPIVNGAYGRIVHAEGRHELTQTLA